MDQGGSAVIAAGVAGVVAVFGSLIGVWVGRRTVRDQARVEHQQWLRGQQQEAYSQLLDAWDQAMRGFAAVLDGSEERVLTARQDSLGPGLNAWDRLGDELDAEAGRLVRPVNEVLERVRLLGPTPVEKAAMNLEDALKGLVGAMRAGVGTAEWPVASFWFEARTNASQCRREFFDEAQTVIRTAPDTARSSRSPR